MSQDDQNPPHHAYEVHISIGAHNKAYVAMHLAEVQALFDKALRHGNDGIVNCSSGGWTGSYSVETETRDITPDAYRQELDAWWEYQRAVDRSRLAEEEQTEMSSKNRNVTVSPNDDPQSTLAWKVCEVKTIALTETEDMAKAIADEYRENGHVDR